MENKSWREKLYQIIKYQFETYGCEKNKYSPERFECKDTCGYKMSDGKCGRLTEELLPKQD